MTTTSPSVLCVKRVTSGISIGVKSRVKAIRFGSRVELDWLAC